jgi:hypothetical protein
MDRLSANMEWPQAYEVVVNCGAALIGTINAQAGRVS